MKHILLAIVALAAAMLLYLPASMADEPLPLRDFVEQVLAPMALANDYEWRIVQEFSSELERWENDPTERVCIITNTGVCFCAGADLKELAAGTYHLPAGKEDWGLLGMSKHQFKKPLIAAVNGICVGGGMGLVLACDLAVCSDHSVFGLPEARHGRASTGDGAILRLMQQIPQKFAAELILVGDNITAEQAERWGVLEGRHEGSRRPR